MKDRLKILIPVIFIVFLFLVSFVMQTNFNTVIMKTLTGHGAETLFLKQIAILGTSFAFMNLLIGSIVICFTAMIVILAFVLLFGAWITLFILAGKNTPDYLPVVKPGEARHSPAK